MFENIVFASSSPLMYVFAAVYVLLAVLERIVPKKFGALFAAIYVAAFFLLLVLFALNSATLADLLVVLLVSLAARLSLVRGEKEENNDV